MSKEIENAFQIYRKSEYLKNKVEIVIPSFIDFDAGYRAALNLVPKHETPEQYKERMKKDWPDDAPVWVLVDNDYSSLCTYERSKKGGYPVDPKRTRVFIANVHGKPPADWRPEC